jgi:hypothetical protein
VRVCVEVELEVADLDLLLRLARAERLPLDALIKRAIAEYVDRAIARLSQQGAQQDASQQRPSQQAP